MGRNRVYVHKEEVHNLAAPKVIVPLLKASFDPGSVVDFGCGLGTFLFQFKVSGVEKVLGLDGGWVDKRSREKYLNDQEFVVSNLNQPIKLTERYDLAICMEVGEHLRAESAEVLVESLTDASDLIVFSAAIPFQGGQNHLNEQWIEYWEIYFHKFGYRRLDMIRSQLWNHRDVNVWYRQNCFVFAKNGTHTSLNHIAFDPNVRAIHPDMYHFKAKELEDIHSGRYPLYGYFKIFTKAIMHRFGLSKKHKC